MSQIINLLLLSALLFASGEPAEKNEAIFAGGCFWCMEPPYEKLEGVIEVKSGYSGGEKENPTYQEVSQGETDHLEVVKVIYDPSKVSYSKLLEVFWKNIDPYDSKGQFCDKGEHYRSAVFYGTPEEKQAFEDSKKKLIQEGKLKPEIATQLQPAKEFYPAEDYHQDYYKKNPIRYKFYRFRCGRDARLEKLWGSAGT